MIKKLCSSVLVVAIVMGTGVVASAAEPTDPYEIKDIETHWAFEPVANLMYAGVLSGYEDQTFRPENKVSRAEFLTALFRTAVVLEDEITVEDAGFASEWASREALLETYSKSGLDVSYQDLNGHWSKTAVAWVKNYVEKQQPGLMAKVFPGNNFNPSQPITREEAAVISSAFLQAPVDNKALSFKDVPSTYKYQQEIKSLVNNGVISGYPDNTFRPQDPVTRAATAVILNKVISDMNQRVNFFETKDYITAPVSTGDVEYVPFFLPHDDVYDGTYETQDELEKKFVAIFKSMRYDDTAYWEFESIEGEVMNDGYEFDTPEFEAEVVKRQAAWEAEQESVKAEIGYLKDEQRADVILALKDSNYWNKSGVYYYLTHYFEEEYPREEYLLKAVEAYDVEKSGADDLFYLYMNLVDLYSAQGNKAKVIEYADKALSTFLKYDQEQLTSVQRNRYYLLVASSLESVGAYEEAIHYLDNYLVDDEYEMGAEVELEKLSIQYLSGVNKDQVLAAMQAQTQTLDLTDAWHQELKDRYTWAMKTIQRGDQ